MKNAFKAMVAMVSLTMATAAWGASEVVWVGEKWKSVNGENGR